MHPYLSAAIQQADTVDLDVDDDIPTDSDLRSVSIPETARIIGCSIPTVRKYSDELGAFRIGRHWRIPLRGIRRFQERGGAA